MMSWVNVVGHVYSSSRSHFQGQLLTWERQRAGSSMIPSQLDLVENKNFWEVLIAYVPFSIIYLSVYSYVCFYDLWDFFQRCVGEKLRRIGHLFNVRTIFKTKHALHVTLTKTVPVRDARQTKNWVYSTPRDCGRRYIGETSRPLKVSIKGTQIQADPRSVPKIKIRPTCVRRRPQTMMERSEALADWTEHQLQEIQGIRPLPSGSSSDQSTQLGHLFHLDFHHWRRVRKTTTPSSLDYERKLYFYVGAIPMPRLCMYVCMYKGGPKSWPLHRDL
jgi:hypothetical protein